MNKKTKTFLQLAAIVPIIGLGSLNLTAQQGPLGEPGNGGGGGGCEGPYREGRHRHFSSNGHSNSYMTCIAGDGWCRVRSQEVCPYC